MEQQLEMFQELQAMSEQPADQVTVAQLEDLITRYKQTRDLYDEAKKAASEANAKVEELEAQVMGMLDKLGKSSYEVEGLGKAIKCMSLVYRTPKTMADKQALFDYIKNAHGEDVYTTMISINHQTLNSWANKEMESGELTKIPGLESPTSLEYLQFRSKK